MYALGIHGTINACAPNVQAQLPPQTEAERMQAETDRVQQHGPPLADDSPAAGSAAAGRAAPSNAPKNARGGWHLNVEVSANCTANIKYLYYYTTKGADRNVASIRRNTNEPVDEVSLQQRNPNPSPSQSQSPIPTSKPNPNPNPNPNPSPNPNPNPNPNPKPNPHPHPPH